MMRWAALLKGVNLNGRKLPMADLKALVEALGYRDVTTLLASGNVVFACDEIDGAKVEAAIEAALEVYGLKTDVVVRSAVDLQAILAANPFAEATLARPNHVVVLFHRDSVPVDRLDALPEVYHGRETLVARGRELYVDYVDGIGESKLPQAMAKLKFPKLATARNWNTVVKLATLLAT
ncbi:DUF1697 domain-containing protein [Sphingomonas sp. RB3P16]|uniref:DUF1697 domain-containing protein n=1 Tax=Parasphingomonas frigoris TaxID=3096163 RepID=UPI002FC7A93F